MRDLSFDDATPIPTEKLVGYLRQELKRAASGGAASSRNALWQPGIEHLLVVRALRCYACVLSVAHKALTGRFPYFVERAYRAIYWLAFVGLALGCGAR